MAATRTPVRRRGDAKWINAAPIAGAMRAARMALVVVFGSAEPASMETGASGMVGISKPGEIYNGKEIEGTS
jgi:hypothetical protein